MKVVISLGGSVISLDKMEFLKEFAEFLRKLAADAYVVVGGGKLARDYINAARKFCKDERFLDEIGIAATRLNALLLASFFGKNIPYTIEEAAKLKPPVIMGGTTPGHSTDAVAAMLAKHIKADVLVIASNVDGIYDKDPRIYNDAKKYDRIKIGKLREIVGKEWKKAGKSMIIDAIACKIIEEEKIRTIVLNGRNLENLENAIYGKKFIGTEVDVNDTPA